MEDAELDAELEKEMEEDNEAKNPELLDESVFNKFATGELDLPEDADEPDMDTDGEDAGEDDSELEAYYEELGIEAGDIQVDEKKAEKMLYKK